MIFSNPESLTERVVNDLPNAVVMVTFHV